MAETDEKVGLPLLTDPPKPHRCYNTRYEDSDIWNDNTLYVRE